MILFIPIIIGLGLISFPIIMIFFKGAVEYTLYWGVVFGTHYDKLYFQTKDKDGEKQNYRLNIIQFHILCVSIMLSFSTKADNIIVEDE